MIAVTVEIDKIADHVNKTRIKASVSKAKEIVNRIRIKDLANKVKAIGILAADATAVDVVDVMDAMKAHRAKIVLNHVMMSAMNQSVLSQ
jgi:ethanolamine utilization microcompartment shell protein EutL